MLAGYSNVEIAKKIQRPVSTVQRRTRQLYAEGYTVPVVHLNFSKFGLRRGLLQFKCKSANLKEAVEKISAIKGVESAGAYLGSLDIVANVVYADSKEVLKIIAEAQKLNLITDVTWSEEIHSVPI
jgi:DNA-binding Lrp family transcriptional regulator